MTRKWLWAPWRWKYLSSLKDRGRRTRTKCLFCRKKSSLASFKNLVVAKGRFAFSMLNLYPYANGHFLIAPYRHVATLQGLTEGEWVELFQLSQDALRRLAKVFSPQGYNLGINLGRSAGAGLPGHLHLHVVPRWHGDTNFMSIFSDTRVVSHSLRAAYRFLKKA